MSRTVMNRIFPSFVCVCIALSLGASVAIAQVDLHPVPTVNTAEEPGSKMWFISYTSTQQYKLVGAPQPPIGPVLEGGNAMLEPDGVVFVHEYYAATTGAGRKVRMDLIEPHPWLPIVQNLYTRWPFGVDWDIDVFGSSGHAAQGPLWTLGGSIQEPSGTVLAGESVPLVPVGTSFGGVRLVDPVDDGDEIEAELTAGFSNSTSESFEVTVGVLGGGTLTPLATYTAPSNSIGYRSLGIALPKASESAANPGFYRLIFKSPGHPPKSTWVQPFPN